MIRTSRLCHGLLSAIVVTACASAATAQDYNHITHGPILGRVTSNGVGVWARTHRAGVFAVKYGTRRGRLDQVSEPATTSLEHDNTGVVYLAGLKANTRYYYTLFVPEDARFSGRSGTFKTMPDRADYVDPERNPEGLFNFSFEFACGNNQNPASGSGPATPTFATMLRKIRNEIDFAILNGDWLYETQREYTPQQWQLETGATEIPELLNQVPTITGVWQNYKHFLSQSENLSRWHRNMPSFFTYDDHEVLNDVWGAGTPGLRDRRAVFRDIGARAWYDYLGWSNPTDFEQPVHFGRTTLTQGNTTLYDPKADFSKLDLAQASNLHVHWGTKTAGVNLNELDGVGGDPNAGVYRLVRIVDRNRLEIEPAPPANSTVSYSIGRRSYYRMRIANCDFFVCDTRGQRQMHDTRDPYKKGLSMLGPVQKKWLMDGIRQSDADFIFVVSSVNFMVPHVGGGVVRGSNKDDAWTVFYDEREQLIDFWDSLDKPVFVLSGDLHNSFVIRVTDNVWEMASGPHNSNNHWYTDEGDRPANGPFKYGPREVDIHWSTWFGNDIPRSELRHPTYCVVKVQNVFNNPLKADETRWVAFPRPHVIFRYYDGKTGELRYAETVQARTR